MLIVAAGARYCAFPLECVDETMRPLAIEPVAGTPDFVRGVAVIRGAAIPVVDLQALLGTASRSFGRFVTLKIEDRRIAIGVDAVVGFMTIDVGRLGALPPLLRGASADVVEAIGSRDRDVLVVLRAARLVPDDLWKTLEASA